MTVAAELLILQNLLKIAEKSDDVVMIEKYKKAIAIKLAL